MVRRSTRSDLPTNIPGALQALGTCRKAMLDVSHTVKPMGPAYHGANMVVSAIDGFATFLTGQRYYFSLGGSVAPGRAEELRKHQEEVDRCR